MWVRVHACLDLICVYSHVSYPHLRVYMYASQQCTCLNDNTEHLSINSESMATAEFIKRLQVKVYQLGRPARRVIHVNCVIQM